MTADDWRRDMLTATAPALCAATMLLVLAVSAAGPCDILHSHYTNNTSAECPQWVSVYGAELPVSVWWDGSAPSRAAAALLLAAVRHGLRYRGLRMRRLDSELCDFIRRLPHNCEEDNDDYYETTVLPSARQCMAADVCAGGGGRLRAVGAGAAPAALRLHVRLAPRARSLHDCERAMHWTFYENATAIRHCSFLTFTNQGASRDRAIIFTSEELVAVAMKLRAPNLHWTIKSLHLDVMQPSLFDLIRSTDESILFLDYDIWSDASDIRIVDPPPLPMFDPVCTLRFADAKLLNQLAPQLNKVILDFNPTVGELREVLALETNHTDSNITEAACDWANRNRNRFESWFQSARKLKLDYWIAVFICKDDEDREQYKRVAHRIINMTDIGLKRIEVKFIEDLDCASECDLKNRFSKFRLHKWNEMIGVLATGADIKGATYMAAEMETALVLYDTPARGVTPGNNTRIVGGPLTELVLALQRLLADCNWKRLAVLSEQTHNESFNNIILVARGATGTEHLNNSDERIRQALNDLWSEGAVWPQLASPLADGLLLLINSFRAFIGRCERNLYDLHGEGTTRLFWKSLNSHVFGVTQELHPTPYVYTNPLIFIDEWHGAVRRNKAIWRSHENSKHEDHRCPLSPKHILFSDGTQYCISTMSNRNKFMPHCHDIAWLILAVTIVIGMLALCIARWLREKILKRSDPLLRPREPRQSVVALAEHLVDRAALEFRHELGFGRFGRVRFAILHAPNRPTVVVAAKSLREDVVPTEETEFLREACTLASLRHENVVRLIGVCATDGPPLVLMEHAFFGDLLAYLRERRHLVEHGNDEFLEEATHVSPHALTRLAREASSALAYLAQRRLVHRDLRAANCLVDARRSLKLADFGMAREITGNDQTAEYTCRRRGFFPVLWMAPESLDRGVFSTATDVWALGILMLELVTLGERPYSVWSPLRVMRYVIAGGRPLLPFDASLKTRGLLLSCWRRDAKQRPTAAEVAAYLATNPLALSPALETAPLSPKNSIADLSIF